jgi:hypothetical protein
MITDKEAKSIFGEVENNDEWNRLVKNLSPNVIITLYTDYLSFYLIAEIEQSEKHRTRLDFLLKEIRRRKLQSRTLEEWHKQILKLSNEVPGVIEQASRVEIPKAGMRLLERKGELG